jgi:hypothetical protein
MLVRLAPTMAVIDSPAPIGQTAADRPAGHCGLAPVAAGLATAPVGLEPLHGLAVGHAG